MNSPVESFYQLLEENDIHISTLKSDHDAYLSLIKKRENTLFHQSFANHIGIKTKDNINALKFPKKLENHFTYQLMKSSGILILEDDKNKLHLFFSHFKHIHNLSYWLFLTRKPFDIYYISEIAYLKKMREIFGQQKQGLPSQTSDNNTQTGSHDLLDTKHEGQIAKFLDQIIQNAIEKNASDIHLESFEKESLIRFRVDGCLHIEYHLSRESGDILLNKIKLLSGFDIAKHLLPQDGRFKVSLGDKSYDIRVSTSPTLLGERVVLRLHDRDSQWLKLSNLELPAHIETFIKKTLIYQGGIFLVTGPTGSGKSTTLYSALSEVDAKHKNIMTIEDPVEYKLPYASQISVNPKVDFSFAKGLRHILRQDPDIILIGEIRDQETARIAIQASLTGHLVLSTLHTKNASDALIRLKEMGIETHLISQTLIGVINQRLLKKNCPHCLEINSKNYPALPQHLKNISHYQSKGCLSCSHTKTQGRVGVYELLINDSELQKLLSNTNTSDSIKSIEQSPDFKSLSLSAKNLLVSGTISLDEYLTLSLE